MPVSPKKEEAPVKISAPPAVPVMPPLPVETAPIPLPPHPVMPLYLSAVPPPQPLKPVFPLIQPNPTVQQNLVSKSSLKLLY